MRVALEIFYLLVARKCVLRSALNSYGFHESVPKVATHNCTSSFLSYCEVVAHFESFHLDRRWHATHKAHWNHLPPDDGDEVLIYAPRSSTIFDCWAKPPVLSERC
jgi:hypothetical protein